MSYEFDDPALFFSLTELAERVTYSDNGVAKTITAVILEQENLGEGDGIDRVFSANLGNYATAYIKKSDVASPEYTKDTITTADGRVWRIKNNALANGKMWKLTLEKGQRMRG